MQDSATVQRRHPLRRFFDRWRARRTGGAPMLLRDGDMLELRFVHGTGQSRMSLQDPDWLTIEYTRTMLGALRLRPDPRRIGIVGVGGGSQLKFCRRYLPQARIEGFEIDPRVLALRDAFRIPPDDARLQLHCADAAIALKQRRSAYDLLLVDAYDPAGIPPALSTQAFYDNCRAALAPGGVYAGNLYASDERLHRSRLEASFGNATLALRPAGQPNLVVLAWQPGGPDWPVSSEEALAAWPERARLQLQAAFEAVDEAIAPFCQCD